MNSRLIVLPACGSLVLIFLFTECADDTPIGPVLRCPDVPIIRSGEATYYYADGTGSCSFDSTPNDLMVAAMNSIDYEGSRLCGARVLVSGPQGSVLVRIVDMCPECPVGNIDLSPQAFSCIADTLLGRVKVRWQIVPHDTTAPIVYHFNDSSTPTWLAVQIRNHRYPIYSLEHLGSQGRFERINRAQYNYFVREGGLGEGPFTFRVTDIYGHVLVDSGIAHIPGRDTTGRGQFEFCEQ